MNIQEPIPPMHTNHPRKQTNKQTKQSPPPQKKPASSITTPTLKLINLTLFRAGTPNT